LIANTSILVLNSNQTCVTIAITATKKNRRPR
jgi:hypothetical protein